MNCEVAHERIVLAAYGELADDQIHELDRHLTTCADCLTEREQLQALKTLAAVHPVAEPPANLVARSRMRLEEALDAIPPKRWYERFGENILNHFARLQALQWPRACCWWWVWVRVAWADLSSRRHARRTQHRKRAKRQ